MKTPVFHFQEEVLTDAPLELIKEKLAAGLPCLKACPGLQAPHACGEGIVLRWQNHLLGAVEEGTLRAEPHPTGAHLKLDGRIRGWSAFLVLGWIRFRTDRLLENLVKELE